MISKMVTNQQSSLKTLFIFFQEGKEVSEGGDKGNGNCEEEVPEKPVGPLSAHCRPTDYQQVTNRLPTISQIKHASASLEGNVLLDENNSGR